MGNLQGPESDLWSLGILLYELHIGKEPFAGKSSSDMLHLISNQAIKFSSKFFSREAMNLVKALLKFKPHKRITIKQLLNSRFVRKSRHSNHDEPDRVEVASKPDELHFDPPQQVFTSQYGQSRPARRSRPKTKQRPLPSVATSQTSLYQPLNRVGRSARRVSRVKRPPQDSVIRPKIYLKNASSSGTKGGLWNESGLAQHRATQSRNKTMSEHSLGFLSKEENITSSREIQIVSGSRLNPASRENNPKETITTGNEFRRGRHEDQKQNDSWMNLSGSLVPKRAKSFMEAASGEETSNDELSGSVGNWRQRSRTKCMSRSNEKHFIRSTNSEIKLPLEYSHVHMNSEHNQVSLRPV